ncbi:MAG: hypothetical protein ACRCX2_19915 [Paraclostridium sp.]
MFKLMLLKSIKGIFKHICFTLITNIFKKYFNTETQEELVIELVRNIIIATPNKKDDRAFNIAFGNSKFKILVEEEKV